jgi:hypothetical protein
VAHVEPPAVGALSHTLRSTEGRTEGIRKSYKGVQEATTGVPAPDWMEAHKALLAVMNQAQGQDSGTPPGTPQGTPGNGQSSGPAPAAGPPAATPSATPAATPRGTHGAPNGRTSPR